jgi:tRNA-splicing ligase RtcB
MFEIKGKFSTAKVMTDNIEEEAIAQITELVNNQASEGSKIVIMPDVHAGKGCTIGTTMTFSDKIVPNLVGVDIGCSVSMSIIQGGEWMQHDLKKLDEVIRKVVPSGMNVHDKEDDIDLRLDELYTPLSESQKSWIKRSLGTLGSGNHYVALEGLSKGLSSDVMALMVHTGSRNLGKQVAEYHQGIAIKNMKQKGTQELINRLKSEGRANEIEEEVKKYKLTMNQNPNLATLEGEDLEHYLHDVEIAQSFAHTNHITIVKAIFDAMGWIVYDTIMTTHNYVDLERKIIRKGAVDATKYSFLVPLNMLDGTLVFRGRENEEWNYSSPHGAGRVMSRSKAKAQLSLDDFKDSMKDVYSTSIGKGTLDEAPLAYKPKEEIINALDGVYELVSHLKPIYNFKASELNGEE